MKALITAGGRGTRLRPLTHTQNKHLIPIANKPILHYALENVRDAGIRECAIVISPETGPEVRAAIGDGAAFGLKISYLVQDEPRGLAHCVLLAREFMGDEPFVFYLGDNMVVGGIRRFVDAFEKSRADCLLTLAHVPHPERFGVPTLDGDRIVAIQEKPANPASRFAIAGIYMYTSAIFDAAASIVPSARGELEISDAHQALLDGGKLVVHETITGWWKDTGSPDDLLEANRFVLEHLGPSGDGEMLGTIDSASTAAGPVRVGRGTRIVRSRINGPVVIGENCVIEDAYVGPFTSIGPGSAIIGSEIEFSILLDRSRLERVGRRMAHSILGYDAEVFGTDSMPRVHRLMIGDQSRVELV